MLDFAHMIHVLLPAFLFNTGRLFSATTLHRRLLFQIYAIGGMLIPIAPSMASGTAEPGDARRKFRIAGSGAAS
jgi:hypothetical protein